MKFGSTFISLYLMMILTFTGVSWVLDEYWAQELEQDVESYTGYKSVVLALGGLLNHRPDVLWPLILDQASQRLKLPVHLIEKNAVTHFTSEQQTMLASGQVVVYYENTSIRLYQLLGDNSTLLALGPVKVPTRPKQKAFIRVFFLLITALVILLWLWPLSRDLDALQKSTRLFGKGNLDIKAPTAFTPTIAPVVKTFNMMAERIKTLIAEQQELTNAVSHELRTPLARTKFALQMLEKSRDSEKSAQYIAQISSDVTELDELINEMLLYAAFEHDKPVLDFKPQPLADIIEQQIAKHSCFNGDISFINHTQALQLVCDRRFIDRALNNYLANAVKYGRGEIRVALTADDKHCYIRVEDNGGGVADDFKSLVFDAFSRGDKSRNRETGGFGLGLAIVQKIMLWHRGRAYVEDSDLGGACFVLCLPLTPDW
ncbi:two-component sensor histidine kinase [Thalassomonas viridans]|uniref:histidine kinase n=1 Tax=Thalassomonas viridans TaxID=137584 RepID=A0AAE9Z7H6_9GAMM|nr:ATP-binding protein [Thalassomonas viridans]WDE07672.1 two-component sensor histidine kinase [Thalassomonas viridans]